MATPTRSVGSRVLIIEDDALLGPRLVTFLQQQGFDALLTTSLRDARELLQGHAFDVVVLDLNLGSSDGLDLLRELSVAHTTPVVVASSRIDEADRILGIELGADDYLCKPFSYRELAARLRGIIRRRSETKGARPEHRVARFDRWAVDLRSHVAVDDSGRRVRFTPGENDLLKVLLAHPRSVILRRELLELTRRDDAAAFPRVIDVLVARLRSKLEADSRHPEIITTVRGEGYCFQPAVTWDDRPL